MAKKKFRVFHQHQYHIFTLPDSIDGYIGTRRVGPCIAFFLYEPENKRCLAIHLDICSSMEAIKSAIQEFLPDYQGIERCQAHFVGGWKRHMRVGANALELPKFLRTMNVVNINTKNLLRYDAAPLDFSAANFYENVVFNLDSGQLEIRQSKIDAHRDFELVDLDPNEKSCYKDCMEYLRTNGNIFLRNSFGPLLLHKKYEDLDPRVQAFFDPLLEQNNGYSFIPVTDITATAMRQTLALRVAARGSDEGVASNSEIDIAKDALEVIRLLYINFANPILQIPTKNNNTPLHYACVRLNENPHNFPLKVMVMLLITHGKRDLSNTAGNTALSKLSDPALREFKELCTSFLQIFCSDEYTALNSPIPAQICTCYRATMANVVPSLVLYPTMSPVEKIAAEEQFMLMIGMLSPKRKAALLVQYNPKDLTPLAVEAQQGIDPNVAKSTTTKMAPS